MANIITVITLIGTIGNSFQKSWCFYIWIPTNLFWTIYNLYIGQYQQALLYAVNLVTSIIGLYRWRLPKIAKKPRKAKTAVVNKM